mmetsp:Transcript_11065/g.24294  ORF Transcript_11065/g.24294 Transcript_11065/m.24294 type:complete len:854 (+) Transcript_11065:1158-3719(+)
MIGIGADLLFVFTDAWKQGLRAARKSSTSTRDARRAAIVWVYEHAAMSCAATTFSTAASFFANLASVLPALREFGFFMGSAVVAAYFIVTVTFPPVLVLQHKYGCCKKRRRATDQQAPKPSATESQDGEGTEFRGKKAKKSGCGLKKRWALALWRWKRVIVPVLFVSSIVAGVVAALNAELNPDPELNVFPLSHPLQKSLDLQSEFKTPESHETVGGPRPRPLDVCAVGDHSRPYGIQFAADSQWGSGGGSTARRRVNMPGASDNFQQPNGRKQCAFFACETLEDPLEIAEPKVCSCFQRLDLRTCKERQDYGIDVHLWLVGEASSAGVNWDVVVHNAVQRSHTNVSFVLSQAQGRLPDILQQHWKSGKARVAKFVEEARWRATVHDERPTLCDFHYVCYCEARVCTPHLSANQGGSWVFSARVALQEDRRRALESSATTGVGLRPASQSPLPNHLMKQVTVIYGIVVEPGRILLGSAGKTWSFDRSIDFENAWTQRILKSVCDDLPYDLYVYADSCTLSLFYDHLRTSSSTSLFFPTDSFHSDVLNFVNPSVNPLAFAGAYWREIWFDPDGVPAPRTLAIKLEFPSAPPLNSDIKVLKARWDKYLGGKNAEAAVHVGSGADHGWHSAEMWKEALAVEATLESVQVTVVLAVGLGLLGSWLFTRVLRLALFVMVTVILVICWQLFFMVVVMGWMIGAVEVISLIVFIGYSITYCIHLVHAYGSHVDEFGAEGAGHDTKGRHRRAAFAIATIGSAIGGSAMTTLVSAVLLLFCQVVIFVKFGVVICVITVLSVFFSLVFLPSLLMLAGPTQGRGVRAAMLAFSTCVFEQYELSDDDWEGFDTSDIEDSEDSDLG